MKRRLLLLSLILSLIVPHLSAAAETKPTQTTFILIRHAERLEGKDPDLSPDGYQRAGRLAAKLSQANIDAVYTTDFIRTKRTVLLVAAQKDLEVQLYDHKEPDSVTENWLKQHQGQTLLIAGHSDTTPLFANALMGHEYFQEKFDESDFGNLVIITVAADRNSSQLLHLRF